MAADVAITYVIVATRADTMKASYTEVLPLSHQDQPSLSYLMPKSSRGELVLCGGNGSQKPYTHSK